MNQGLDIILVKMKEKRFYIAAFLIPWLVVLVYGFVTGTWPFQGKSLLEGDTGLQYVELYYELWHKVRAGESLFYSWNAFGGYDFFVNMLYYLVSPFTALILILPKSLIPAGVQFIMVLKCSCVSLAMTYFFNHTKHNTLKEQKELVSLFLGVAFGISNGMLYFMKFFNWMDAMILFPFLLLSIEKMMEGRGYRRFCVLLALAILTNYYIMYHVCIFLVFWFFLQMDRNTSHKLKKFLLFAGSSVWAALMAMVAIFPTVLTLHDRESADMAQLAHAYVRYIFNRLTDIVQSFFIMQPISIYEFAPNVYFSVAAVFLAVLFCFIRMGKKKKLYIILFALFMTASFSFGLLNILWHGFTVPTGVYNRFVNMYIFLLLFMAMQVMIHLSDIRLWQILAAGITVLFLVGITFISIKEYQAVYVYLITIMLVVFYLLMLILYKRQSITHSQILLVFVLAGLGELCVNAYNGLNGLLDHDFFKAEGNAQIMELSEKAELQKGARIAYPQCFYNMGMVTNLPVASGFLSLTNGNINRLYRNLGMESSNDVQIAYCGGSPLLNLMLNIEYGIAVDELQYSDEELVTEKDGYYLYKIQRGAGLGYMVDNSVLDWDVNGGQPFDLQNSFVRQAVDGENIFKVVHPEVKCQLWDMTLEPNADILSEQNIYSYVYATAYGDERDALQMQFTVEEDQDLYLIRTSYLDLYAQVYIDGVLAHDEVGVSVRGTIPIGKVKKGQVITVVFSPADSADAGKNAWIQCQMAAFDEAAYEAAYERLTESVYHVDTMEADYVKGSISVKKPGLMMTSIQAVDGFQVLVDGKESSYEVVGDTMIAVPLETGEHVVEFIYQTPGIWQGIVISGVSILAFLVSALLKKRFGDKEKACER